MNTGQYDPLDLRKIISIFFKRKWLILLSLVGALAPIIYYNMTSIPIYVASTTIVFEEHQGPAASINPFKISLNKSFITNQIEEIKSSDLLHEVAAVLPISIINTYPSPANPAPHFDKTAYVGRHIRRHISANSVPNSEIIKISVEAYSPIAAKIIANTVADVLKKRNLQVRREETDNVRNMIDEQLVVFKKQLDEAEIALKTFKEKSKVTVITQESQEIYHRITEAEVSYNQAKANLDAAQKRLSFIQSKLKKERKDLVPSITKITSPWAQKLKEQLVDLEVRYTTLKVQNYADDHPKMVELKQSIDQTKANLKEESLKIAAGENIVDPITQIQKYMEESIALEIEIQTYQSQERALKEVIDNYNRNLNTLPDKELRLARLMRDKEVNTKIYTMLLEKREEAKIAEAERVGNIRIIDPASVPSGPIRPRKLLNLMIGFILGLSLGIAAAFIIEFVDDSVKSIEAAEKITDLSVLGTIPKIRSSVQNNIVKNSTRSKSTELYARLITQHNPKSPESEAFRTLRTNLQFSGIDAPIQSVLFTSANPGEGKSLIISNLSIATAQMGRKTLLIDADLRKPILNKLFTVKREPGLINVVSKTFKFASLNDTIMESALAEINSPNIDSDTIPIESTKNKYNEKDGIASNELSYYISQVIHKTDVPNLDLLTSGTIPPNPSEILGSKAMFRILEELKGKYDTIFIDTPPINLVTDSGILGPIVDGSVLVLKAGHSKKHDIFRAKELLIKSKSKALGLIVNYADTQAGYSSYNYYYHYVDGNGKQKSKNKS